MRRSPSADPHARQSAETLGILLLLTGAAVAGWGALAIARASETRSWQAAAGSVEDVSLGVETVGYSAGRTSNRPVFSLRCHVTYRYTVNGAELTSDQLDTGPAGRRNARRDCARYTVGRPVTVYYDPAAPSSAVLERGIPASAVIALAVGLVGVFMGVARQGWVQRFWADRRLPVPRVLDA